MGYNINLVYSNFELPEVHERIAIEDINRYFNIDNTGSLDKVMEYFLWTVFKEDNKWVDLEFLGEKWHKDHFHLFNAIAPYVPTGCYIEMQGEEGDRFRWVFEEETCKEITPEIRWEEPPIKLDSLEERDVTWLVGDEGRNNVIFADVGDYYLHIEIIPENYPGLGISWISKDEGHPTELIEEYYQGWNIRKNGLELYLEDLELESLEP
jgi:hypothetical protein